MASLCDHCRRIPKQVFQRGPEDGVKYKHTTSGRVSQGNELFHHHHRTIAELRECAETCLFCKVLLSYLPNSWQVTAPGLRSILGADDFNSSLSALAPQGQARVDTICLDLTAARVGGIISSDSIHIPIGYHNPGEPLPFELSPYDSAETIQMIDRWLQACDQNHVACDVDAYAHHVASVGPRPSIEKYEEKSVSRFVKLVISSKSRQESRAAFEGLRAWAQRIGAAPTKRNRPADAGQGEGTETYLPTRLIDVGSVEQLREPRLVLDSECPPGSRYLALSHCWGLQSAHPVPRTVKDNYEEHRAEITFNKLPRTFQDTIVFARKLHIPYVWIDSLCIIQGDADDWEKESARMGDVYKNAYCTLAASASSNSSEGLFHQRSFDDGLKPVSLDLDLPSQNGINLAKVFIRPPILNPREEVTRAILTTRAWTMQERALSRRIVHFTRTRLLWECRTCTLNDTNPEDEREYASVMPLTWYQDGETIRQSFDTSTVSEYCANLWRTLMQYFSGRDITYEKDTFPAVSGLAKTLQPFIGGRYLAGIWENDVLNGLAWKLSDEYDFRNPGAPEPIYEGSYSPSWSWAAKGPVKFEMWEDFRASERRNSKEAAKEDRTMTYVDAKIDLSGKDDTGTISFASLTLRGRLKQVPYLDSSNLGRYSHFMFHDLAVEGAKSKETKRERSIRVKWDFEAEPIERHSSSSGGQESSETEESDTDSTDSSGPASHIYLFELRRRLTIHDKPSSSSYSCDSIGLVIEELAEHRHQGDNERRFTRLGFCEWEDKLNWGEHDCFVGIEDTNITLV